MAYYTQELKRAKDPNNGRVDMDMYVVWTDKPSLRQVAYCPSLEDAERIKALLAYYGDRFPTKEGE